MQEVKEIKTENMFKTALQVLYDREKEIEAQLLGVKKAIKKIEKIGR